MSWFKKLFSNSETTVVEPVVETVVETESADAEKFDYNTSSAPYVDVVKITIPNPKDPTVGYFELDWNDAFVQQLREAGYSGRKDEDVVDQWFNDLCRGVVSEDEF